ncbi:uncharacterized protein LOC142820967 [Pelodiscus sinensis]|uniref:uncharacterized protein LOC142820967 n=1 Tax=Pelodiscus sinensis TaxID=13735 RepID=UPI003F6B3759
MSEPPDATQPSPSSREPARDRKKRAPVWSSVEIVDLIEVWGEVSNVHDLCTSHRNVAVYSHMADSLATRGHLRTREQVRCKIKDLQQSYSRACLPGADLEACPHFQALDCILGAHAVHAPRVVIDPGAEGPVPDTEEEEQEQEDTKSQEPAGSLPRIQDPRGTPQSTSPVSSEAGEASTSAAPGTAGRTPPCNSHPHPGQQACQEPGGVPAVAPAVPGSPAPHPGPLGPGGPAAAAAEFGGAGEAGLCPQRPPPDPGGQVPASSCTDPCSRPSFHSSSHSCSPSRFLRTPCPSCPTLHTHSPLTPPHPQCCKTGEPARPPTLSFPFPSSPFPAPSSLVFPPFSHPHSSLPPSQLCKIKRDFGC